MARGLLSDFFGFGEEQAGKDVDAGNAEARNDAEVNAKADWMVDSALNDPPPPPDNAGSSGGGRS